MIQPANPTSPAAYPGPSALRELSRAFAHIGDFRRFAEMLESVLGRAEFFAEAKVQLFEGGAPGPDVFSTGKLTLPLAGREQTHGVLRVAGGSQAFGPEDIHLMSSLASVMAAAMDHATHHNEIRRNLEVLSFLINLSPVGMLAIDGTGRVALANDAARRWLGAADDAGIPARLTSDVLGVDWRAQPCFHLRADGKLAFVEVKSVVGADGKVGASAFVFTDLTADQGRLIDGLQRELYRCRWLGVKLSFILLESTQSVGGLLQRLPELRGELRIGELAGPYDAFRVGVVLPDVDRTQARERLRGWDRLLGGEGLKAAVVTPSDTSVERTLTEALGAMQPVEGVLRRALLLHDDYPAVNDMLALVLGHHFEVVKSSCIRESEALLRQRSFDGLVTEVELRSGASGLELARLAKQLHPNIRPFFTTVTHAQERVTDDPLLEGHLVIPKPFDVRRLESVVRSVLP